MPKKRKTLHPRKKENWFIFIRRRFFLFSALVVSALLFASQINLTQDYRTKNVLGDSTLPTTNQERRTDEATRSGSTRVIPNTSILRTTKTKPRATFKYKYELKQGKASLMVEDSAGHKISTEEATRRELEKEMETKGVKVSSADGELTLGHDSTQATTHFPLAVDPETHELTVTTPVGTKTVTVLPDEAVNNFFKHGRVGATESGILTASGSGFVGENR